MVHYEGDFKDYFDMLYKLMLEENDYKYIPNIIEERINGKISKIEITINAHNRMPDF